jgi:hypothetical protein
MDNIGRFNLVAGIIFARLYKMFPLRGVMLAEYLQQDCERLNLECGFAKRELVRLFSDTMLWLRDNGYISFSDPPKINERGIFSNVVLTAKGLEALKKSPESIDTGETIGEAISKAIKDNVADRIAKLVTFALGASASLIFGG